jgi:hypothetical protein
MAAVEKFRESWSIPFGFDHEVMPENEFLEQQPSNAKKAADDSCDTLKQNPIRCGLLRYDCQLQFRDSGLYLE